MNKFYTIIAALLVTATSFAQSPEKMSYQVIIRDSGDNLVVSQAIGIQISILQTTASGTPVYVETHTSSTNVNGLLSLEIGTGTTTDDFSTIDWGADTYFIKTETDPTGGSNYTITGTSQLLSVPYALHAKTAENVLTYKIGDFAHGGIVFWVDDTGQHGLVCVKQDQTSIRWYAGTEGNTQAKGDGIYAGKANTAIIIAAQVAIGDDGGLYAARICNELQIMEGGITYGDWYLPSKFGLNQMYINRVIINDTATANGGAAFSLNEYWSSTEGDLGNAWRQNFSSGNQGNWGKGFAHYVRAVRAF